MRVRVESTRRTWLLILLAISVAALLTAWSASSREPRQRAAPPEDSAVEVELIENTE
jgi:hypothetical protein